MNCCVLYTLAILSDIRISRSLRHASRLISGHVMKSNFHFCASTKSAHEKYEGIVIKKIKKFARRALTNGVRRANLYYYADA